MRFRERFRPPIDFKSKVNATNKFSNVLKYLYAMLLFTCDFLTETPRLFDYYLELTLVLIYCLLVSSLSCGCAHAFL